MNPRTHAEHRKLAAGKAVTRGREGRAGPVARALPFRWEGELPTIIVGIDPGVSTGLATVTREGLGRVVSVDIHEAMAQVAQLNAVVTGGLLRLFVVFEDARLRTWFGSAGREQLQGAGSIKRDCGIWADYLRSLGVRFHGISPEAKGPKLNAAQFARRFGWSERTNEHSRDAGLIAHVGAGLCGMKVDYLTLREGL